MSPVLVLLVAVALRQRPCAPLGLRQSSAGDVCKSAGEDGNVTAVVSAKRVGKRSGYLSVYKSALLPYNIKEPGLPQVDPDSAGVKKKRVKVKVVPAEKGYFARLLKHERFSNVRVLPYDEHCQ